MAAFPHTGDIVIFDHAFDGFVLVLVASVPSMACLLFRATPVSWMQCEPWM